MAIVTITLTDTDNRKGVLAEVDATQGGIACCHEPCTCTPAQKMAAMLMDIMGDVGEGEWQSTPVPKKYQPHDPVMN